MDAEMDEDSVIRINLPALPGIFSLEDIGYDEINYFYDKEFYSTSEDHRVSLEVAPHVKLLFLAHVKIQYPSWAYGDSKCYIIFHAKKLGFMYF